MEAKGERLEVRRGTSAKPHRPNIQRVLAIVRGTHALRPARSAEGPSYYSNITAPDTIGTSLQDPPTTLTRARSRLVLVNEEAFVAEGRSRVGATWSAGASVPRVDDVESPKFGEPYGSGALSNFKDLVTARATLVP
jgi:hypothetical protein